MHPIITGAKCSRVLSYRIAAWSLPVACSVSFVHHDQQGCDKLDLRCPPLLQETEVVAEDSSKTEQPKEPVKGLPSLAPKPKGKKTDKEGDASSDKQTAAAE